jgi:hypothetical protein
VAANHAIVFLIPILVLISGWFIVPLVLNATDWGALSRKYPVRSEFKGRWLNFQSLRLGPSKLLHFNGCISVGFSEDYLYIRLSPLFGSLVKPMQIPWADVASIADYKIFFATYLDFILTDSPGFCIYASAAIKRYLAENPGLSAMKKRMKSQIK